VNDQGSEQGRILSWLAKHRGVVLLDLTEVEEVAVAKPKGGSGNRRDRNFCGGIGIRDTSDNSSLAGCGEAVAVLVKGTSAVRA
jgi:hypothetical protein